MIEDPIATLDGLVLVRPDGSESPVVVRLGRPRLVPPSWYCTVELDGLCEPEVVQGATSLNALRLALGVASARFASAAATGGQFYAAELGRNDGPLDPTLLHAMLGG